MDILADIWGVVKSPLNIIIKYKNSRKVFVSAAIIVLVAVLNGILAPVSYYYTFRNEFVVRIGVIDVIIMFLACIAAYFVSCAVFRLTALIFRKEISFAQIFATWGFSYIPTLVCVIVVNITELTFYYFIGNQVLSVLVCTLLMMVLIWKAIFYFIQLNVVLKINGTAAVMATFIIGCIYLVMIAASFRLGLKVPML